MLGEPGFRHIAVQQGPQPHPDDDPAPDAPEDGARFPAGKEVALTQTDLPLRRPDGLLRRAGGDAFLQVVLQPALRAQHVHEPAADDARPQSGQHIDKRELPAQQPPEQDHGDLVDQRRGDEEGQRDAHRYARRGETQEQRDAGAGTKRRDGPEARAQHVAQHAPPARQKIPHPLHVQPGPQPADDVDHEQQQEQDLGRIVQEEFQRGRRPVAQAGHGLRQQPGQRFDDQIAARPDRKDERGCPEIAQAVHRLRTQRRQLAQRPGISLRRRLRLVLPRLTTAGPLHDALLIFLIGKKAK